MRDFKTQFFLLLMLVLSLRSNAAVISCSELVSAGGDIVWTEVGHGFHVNTRIGLEAALLGVKGNSKAMWGQPATLFEFQKYRIRVHGSGGADADVIHEVTGLDGSPFFLNLALVNGFDVQDITVTDDGNLVIANFLFSAYIWDRKSGRGSLVVPERNRSNFEKLNRYSTALGNFQVGTTLPASWFGKVTASRDGKFIECIEEQMYVTLTATPPYIYHDEFGAYGNSGGSYGQSAWRRVDDLVSRTFISRLFQGESGWEMRTVMKLDGELIGPSSAAWIDQTDERSLILHTRTLSSLAIPVEGSTAFLPQNQHGRVVMRRVGDSFVPVFTAMEDSTHWTESWIDRRRNILKVIKLDAQVNLELFDLSTTSSAHTISFPLPESFPLKRIAFGEVILNEENLDLPVAIPIEGSVPELERGKNDGYVLLVLTKAPDLTMAVIDSRSALFDPIRKKFLEGLTRDLPEDDAYYFPKIEVRFGKVEIRSGRVEWNSFLVRARGEVQWTPIREDISLGVDQILSIYKADMPPSS